MEKTDQTGKGFPNISTREKAEKDMDVDYSPMSPKQVL